MIAIFEDMINSFVALVIRTGNALEIEGERERELCLVIWAQANVFGWQLARCAWQVEQ